VEFGALIATFVTILLFRKYRDKPAFHMEKPIKSWIPLVFLVFMVLGLSLVTSIFPDFHYGTGLVCMATGLAGVVWYLASGGGRTGLGELVKSLDWDSMAFLAGIFVMLGGLSASGALEALARIMGPVAEAGPLALFAITVAISVLVSGFVDNVPYIILMLPVIASLTDPASGLANAEVLSRSRTLIDFGLLIGAAWAAT
jgi:Na+/H+ antiporter NhaD/arsenite permease-like protein